MLDLVTNILCDGQHKTFYIIRCGLFSEAKSCVYQWIHDLKYMYAVCGRDHSQFWTEAEVYYSSNLDTSKNHWSS